MSALVQSGDLSPYTHVLPGLLPMGQKATTQNMVVRRRTVKLPPQAGPSAGTAGAGGAGAQIQFLIPASSGELLDPGSARVAYNGLVSGTAPVAFDDGHPFIRTAITIGGRSVESIENSARLTNIETKMGCSQNWYKSAGSFAGFELLNADLISTVPTTTTSVLVQAAGQFGYVAANLADIDVRQRRAAIAATGSQPGEQREVPLGLVSGLFRAQQYIPLRQMGDMAIQLTVGSRPEVLFQNNTNADGDFSLSSIYLEYDVLECSPEYSQILASSDVVIPFEATTMATPGAVPASQAALSQTDLIVSKATTNMIRTSLVQIPQTLASSYTIPSQSMFSHAGMFSYQVRCGSQSYPPQPASGDAALFAMSLSAYGAPTNENGSCVNRALWGNSTNATTGGTAAVYETSDRLYTDSARSVKFCYGDSHIPTYGFRLIRGQADPLDVDGVNVSGDSGAQLTISIASAPAVAYTPIVSLVSLKFLRLVRGQFNVEG